MDNDPRCDARQKLKNSRSFIFLSIRAKEKKSKNRAGSPASDARVGDRGKVKPWSQSYVDRGSGDRKGGRCAESTRTGCHQQCMHVQQKACHFCRRIFSVFCFLVKSTTSRELSPLHVRAPVVDASLHSCSSRCRSFSPRSGLLDRKEEENRRGEYATCRDGTEEHKRSKRNAGSRINRAGTKWTGEEYMGEMDMHGGVRDVDWRKSRLQ